MATIHICDLCGAHASPLYHVHGLGLGTEAVNASATREECCKGCRDRINKAIEAAKIACRTPLPTPEPVSVKILSLSPPGPPGEPSRKAIDEAVELPKGKPKKPRAPKKKKTPPPSNIQ